MQNYYRNTLFFVLVLVMLYTGLSIAKRANRKSESQQIILIENFIELFVVPDSIGQLVLSTKFQKYKANYFRGRFELRY